MLKDYRVLFERCVSGDRGTPDDPDGSGRGPSGTSYLHHLIVPIAGPPPEHLASFLLFRYPRFGKKTRVGLFDVGTGHAGVDEALVAAVQGGKAKVNQLLARRRP